MSNWIKLTKRKHPVIGQECWVYPVNGEVDRDIWVHNEYDWGNKKRRPDSFYFDNITHYMIIEPIIPPEPPCN